MNRTEVKWEEMGYKNYSIIEEDRFLLYAESICLDEILQVNFISKLSLLPQSGHRLYTKAYAKYCGTRKKKIIHFIGEGYMGF